MSLFTFSFRRAALLFFFLLASFTQTVFATNIISSAAGGFWNSPSSWVPAQVPVAGDNVTISTTININANAACANVTVMPGGSLVLQGGNLTFTGTFNENGYLECIAAYNVAGSGNFILGNTSNVTLVIDDPNGITTNPTLSGSIQNTGGRTFSQAANYRYNGNNVTAATGNGLPTNITGTLTILDFAAGATVTLTNTTNTFQHIILAAGNLSLPGKSITVTNGYIKSLGGNLDSSTRANGGTINTNGDTLTGPISFYILSLQGNRDTITTTGMNAPIVNTQFSVYNIGSGLHLSGTNSVRYASGSTLLYQNADNRGTEWNADLTTPATIGVTPGYPDNVSISNGSDFDVCNYAANGNDGAIPRGCNGTLTASAFTMIDWINYFSANPLYNHNPLLIQTGSFTVGKDMIINGGGNVHMGNATGMGAFIINGSLTMNGASANLNLDSLTNVFSVGNGIIMNNGTLNVGATGVATNLTVTGDIVINNGTVNGASGTISLTGQWKRYGGTFNAQNGTVNFNGTSAQVITVTPGGEVFNNMIINNAGDIGMTYSTTINGNLTFIQGLFLTYSSADVIIGPSGNIIGASQSTGWVARFSGGNLIRNITNTSPYLFAIGNINTYTPVTLTFSSVTTPGTVEMNTPGYNPVLSMPGIATYALSQVNYANWFWYIKQLTGSFGSYNADLNYGTASLQGTATVSSLNTGVYDGTNWTYPTSSGSGTTVTATNITPLNGALENIGLANATCTIPAVYNVTGTGSYCTGGGLPVGLDNSQTGVNYQLQTAGPINVGTPVAGTGSPISFGNQTAGTYTVVATNAVTSTCTSNMAGNAVITMGIPTAPTYTGTPLAEICINSTVNYTTQLGQSNYVWSVPGVLGTDYTIVSGGIGSTNPTVNLTWLTSGTKTVTVNYTSGGCTGAAPATNTTVVDDLPVPTFTTAPSGSVCENSSVTYTTQAGQVFYSWTVPGVAGTDYTITSGGISNTDNTVTLTWLTNGSKTVTVNYYNNLTAFCAGATPASSTITINPLPTPTFTAEPGATACSNVAVTYTTQTGETNYAWNFGVPADYTIVSGGSATDNTTTLKWLTAGNKTVSINYIDVNGCSAASPTSSTTTAVTAGPDASNLVIASASGVCTGSGSTITITSTTLQDDTYTVSYTLGTPNAATLTASMIFVAGTGTFTVPSANLSAAGSTSITITALANSGCSVTGLSAANTIAVGATPTPSFTTEPGTAACTNSIVTYTTQSGQSNYIWTFGPSTDYAIVSGGTTTDNTTKLKWLTAGNKTVTINYTNGSCTTATPTSSVTTAVSVGPDASNLSITATNVCVGVSGSTVTVNSTSLQNDTYNVTYTLGAPNATTSIVSMNFAGGTGTFTVPSGSLHATGTTNITITALSNSGCTTNGLSATNSIIVGTIPSPTFTAEPTNQCYHTDVAYTTQSGQSDYIWDFGGTLNADYSIVSGGSTTDNTVTLQWLTAGSKTVKVNYSNTNNCTATTPASTTATMNNCLPLGIPSAFAPGGKNSVWHIQNGENYPNMQVKVFDRWGKIVYQCTGNPSWDGTYQGQNVSIGTYVYEINVNDVKYPQELKGSVTLVR